jgi:xylulokinase
MMMNGEICILTVDIGTTSVKVSLFDGQFRLLQASVREYRLDAGRGGLVEVDPAEYILAVRLGIAAVLERPGLSENVAAIAVTTQGETLIPVDSGGRPLCKAIVWLDTRAGQEAEALSRIIGRDDFYRTTGLPEINAALPLAKLLHIRLNHPEIYRRTYRFLLLEDYIHFWLTGRFVSEKALLCSTGYFDIIRDDYWPEALDAAGIDADKLPEALRCGEVVGPLLPERAAELRLTGGTVAVTGAMDQAAAALGAGCASGGIVTETTGTALVMAAVTCEPRFTLPPILSIYRHAIDGAYLYLPIGLTAGMTLKWFKDQFCADIAAEHPGQAVYDVMGDMAGRVPAGSEGLLVLPHLAGCINPDNNPDARAVFAGAALNTTRAHFIRAIMESVAYMLKDFITMLEDRGIKVSEIRSMGGGSNSGIWQQIKADAARIPFCTMNVTEVASAGAALLAMWGLGLVPRNTLLPAAVPMKWYMPDDRHAAVYEECYKKYHQLYEATKTLLTLNEANLP